MLLNWWDNFSYRSPNVENVRMIHINHSSVLRVLVLVQASALTIPNESRNLLHWRALRLNRSELESNEAIKLSSFQSINAVLISFSPSLTGNKDAHMHMGLCYNNTNLIANYEPADSLTTPYMIHLPAYGSSNELDRLESEPFIYI